MAEREQQRLVDHRLAVLRHAEEVTGNVVHTYRYFGISRPTFCTWLRRYQEKGIEGLRHEPRRAQRQARQGTRKRRPATSYRALRPRSAWYPSSCRGN
jgi:transposase